MFGFLSSLISSGINASMQNSTNKVNYLMHQQDIAAQYNMQERAQQYAMQNFQAENAEYDRRYQEYLSPEAQVQARIKAGLNPYNDPSSFGSGSAGGSIGVPQGPNASVPSGIPMVSPSVQFDTRDILDTIKLPKELAVLASQSKNLDAQAGEFAAESGYKELLTDLMSDDLPFRKIFNQLGLMDLIAGIGYKKSQTKGQDISNQFEEQSFESRLQEIEKRNSVAQSTSDYYQQQILYYQALGNWIEPQAQANIKYLNAQAATQPAMRKYYESVANSNRVDTANKLAGSFEAFSASLKEMGLSDQAIKEQYEVQSKMFMTIAENLQAICDQNKSESARKAAVAEAVRQCPPWLREGGVAEQILDRISQGADIVATVKGIFSKPFKKPSGSLRTRDVINTDSKGRSTTTHEVVHDRDLP